MRGTTRGRHGGGGEYGDAGGSGAGGYDGSGGRVVKCGGRIRGGSEVAPCVGVHEESMEGARGCPEGLVGCVCGEPGAVGLYSEWVRRESLGEVQVGGDDGLEERGVERTSVGVSKMVEEVIRDRYRVCVWRTRGWYSSPRRDTRLRDGTTARRSDGLISGSNTGASK